MSPEALAADTEQAEQSDREYILQPQQAAAGIKTRRHLANTETVQREVNDGMTWQEFKDAMEARGVKGDDVIGRIRIYPDSPRLKKGAPYRFDVEDTGEDDGVSPRILTQNARMFLPCDERIFWLYFGVDFYFDDSTEIKTWSSVWEINPHIDKEDSIHGCAFPLELPTRCIRACSRSGDAVLEPYAGSGTTLVAAENLNRKCYAIEISPAYVAVCLERMSTSFPHLKIEKVEAAKAA